MDSLKAFLSSCAVVNTENDLRPDTLTVFLQKGQPAYVIDRMGQSQPFTIMLVADPEALTNDEVTALAIVAEQTMWIVVVDSSNQVRGVIEPQNVEDLKIAARATSREGEFGSTITSPPPEIEVRRRHSRINPDIAYCRSLREWWRQVPKEHGRYASYAFFLCLPSDKEAIRYLASYGKELDILSRENCLVIALSKTGLRRSGYDEAVWNLAINEKNFDGYSKTIADLFKIKFTDFPCIVLFEGIRSPEWVTFSLKKLGAEEIAEQIRKIFTVVQQSVTSGKKPISALKRLQNTERLRKIGQNTFSELLGIARKTFEIAMGKLL